MNPMRKALLLLCTSAFICSCSKPIEGKLVDNFGVPLEKVEIKINGSGFKALSDSEGEFDLDYAPGKLEVSFTKDGYVSASRSLEISEKSKYPLGDIELIRLPKEPGLFIKDSIGYIQLPKVKMIKQNRSNQTFFGRVDMVLYSIVPDSIKTIPHRQSEITVFQYQVSGYHLMSPTVQNTLIVEDRFGCLPQKWLLDDQKQANDQLVVRTFTPVPNTIYAYTYGTVNKRAFGTTLKNVKSEVYAFKY